MRKFVLVLAGLSAWCTHDVFAGVPSPTKPIFTNKTHFRIPYNFDTSEMQKIGTQEIRLFLSVNQGETWTKVQAVAPDAGRFNFQAPGDGEYWFSVRTVDGQNRMHPSDEVIEPGLKVVVDTTPPRLELNLRQTAPGRVQLSWRARDENLDPTKLRLEFIQQGVPNWQVVGVIPKAADQTEWSIPQGGNVAVRGSIGDLAGNFGQAEAQTQIAAGNSDANPTGNDSRPAPVAKQNGFPNTYSALNPSEQHPSAAHYPRRPVEPVFGAVNGDPPQVANSAESPFIGGVGGQRATNSFVSMSSGNSPGLTMPGNQTSDAFGGVVGQKFDGRARVVNSRQFQIAYKLQDVGPSGVSGVELYITQDQGQNWFKYGDDVDRQSPFQVEVKSEGTYGFTILVRSGVGLSADPPHPGERPSMVIVVDETPPAAQLLPIEQGRGASNNKLMIRWTAQDEHLVERPILLSYAANRQGPWQPIAAAMENSQGYVWSVGPEVPSKFLIHLEVRDAAGNVRHVETPQPIFIDLSRPSARIVDVESAGAGPQ